MRSSTLTERGCCSCVAAETPTPVKPLRELQTSAASVLAAATIAASLVSTPLPVNAELTASTNSPALLSSSQTVAAKVVRQGVYGEFEYDLPEQKYDDARSTYKAAKETKSNKGTYRVPGAEATGASRRRR